MKTKAIFLTRNEILKQLQCLRHECLENIMKGELNEIEHDQIRKEYKNINKAIDALIDL